MGILLWLGCGTVAFGLARIIPVARPIRWFVELFVALLIAFVLGLVATRLDFGGWGEPDWRAGVFAFFGALAAVGLVRGVTMRA